MDMSFFGQDDVPVAVRRLDYGTLRAVLAAGRVEATGSSPRAPAEPEGTPSAVSCLVAVLLGRGGWTEAARALGGRFALPVCMSSAEGGQR